MTSISSRIQFLIQFVKIPPEMWDFIVPQGPVFKSHAIKEYMMAGVVRDISLQVADKEVAHQLRFIGAEMVKFASANLINGWEDGDDICPRWPHYPIPHTPGYGPQPDPWFQTDYAALNPQPLPPRSIHSALKVLADLTSLPAVAQQLKEISTKLDYARM